MAPLIRLGHDRVRGTRKMGLPGRGQNRDVRRRGVIPQTADKLHATHDRHHHVGDHQIRWRLPHGPQRSGAIPGIAHFMPGPLEDPPQQETLVRFVIDHQDPRHATLNPLVIAT